jgi:hypothetical protein
MEPVWLDAVAATTREMGLRAPIGTNADVAFFCRSSQDVA